MERTHFKCCVPQVYYYIYIIAKCLSFLVTKQMRHYKLKTMNFGIFLIAVEKK